MPISGCGRHYNPRLYHDFVLELPMPPRRQDDIMNVDSEESDASLDYDEPRRKGKGKAPKKRDKRKGKVTEVRITPGRLKPATGSSFG